MSFDNNLYNKVVNKVRAIAKSKGILFEGEQCEIVYEIVKHDPAILDKVTYNENSND